MRPEWAALPPLPWVRRKAPVTRARRRMAALVRRRRMEGGSA
ncbi:hypothetical protein GOFOIKOB_1632 [Methylobacterium tardum]|uniref:Uncharacterized protein n=2 Tax=Methylobacterium TaxID=407 RepID=A0AAJ1TIB1_9HYPH|nr:hypothetical protein WYO_3156 [Methylobacterium sp. GXF4]MBA9064283.1 hypothetical protein [Methylobacterium fujisawaense]MDQ0541535.1 hypothetical protein [Methylobacterium brachiatum]SFU92462.1 hypothetical protein SAMN02799643_03204 [Methylobacterium sp. UNCCL125]GJE48601.1 hypothetical protein GOFOIKOB_1632 [Methylobacterium tardum]